MIRKTGQINFTFRDGQQSIDLDSDARQVRELRDACIRWLDRKADEDATTAAMVRRMTTWSAIHARSICWRYQELRGQRLAFSCDCNAEGCPDGPDPMTRPAHRTATHDDEGTGR